MLLNVVFFVYLELLGFYFAVDPEMLGLKPNQEVIFILVLNQLYLSKAFFRYGCKRFNHVRHLSLVPGQLSPEPQHSWLPFELVLILQGLKQIGVRDEIIVLRVLCQGLSSLEWKFTLYLLVYLFDSLVSHPAFYVNRLLDDLRFAEFGLVQSSEGNIGVRVSGGQCEIFVFQELVLKLIKRQVGSPCPCYISLGSGEPIVNVTNLVNL